MEVRHARREGPPRHRLEAQRIVTTKGILREVNLKKKELTIARDGADSDRLTLPWVPINATSASTAKPRSANG